MTSYLTAIVMHIISVPIYKIFYIEMCMTLTLTLILTFRMGKMSNVNIPLNRAYGCLYLMAVVLVASSGTIYEIFATVHYLVLAFRMDQGQM